MRNKSPDAMFEILHAMGNNAAVLQFGGISESTLNVYREFAKLARSEIEAISMENPIENSKKQVDG